jgi:hypothetical protein
MCLSRVWNIATVPRRFPRNRQGVNVIGSNRTMRTLAIGSKLRKSLRKPWRHRRYPYTLTTHPEGKTTPLLRARIGAEGDSDKTRRRYLRGSCFHPAEFQLLRGENSNDAVDLAVNHVGKAQDRHLIGEDWARVIFFIG